MGFKFISQAFSHSSSLQRSSCKMFASGKLLIHKYMAVSSANSLTLDLTCRSGRSLMSHIVGALRGLRDLGRRAIYFQGAGEHWLLF